MIKGRLSEQYYCSVPYCVPQLYPILCTLIMSSSYRCTESVELGLVFVRVFVFVLTWTTLFVTNVTILYFCVLFGSCLVVSTSAID